MTITPIGGGVDVPAYVADTAGNKQNAIVVVPVNADGTPAGGGGGSSTSPTIVGGEYNSTVPTLPNGQTDALQLDANGNLRVYAAGISTTGADGIGNTLLVSMGQAASNSPLLRPLVAAGFVYNGTSWDRTRGDTVSMYSRPTPRPKSASAVTAASTTSQQLFAANTLRSRVIVQNQDSSINIFINLNAAAVAGGGNLRIAPGGSVELEGVSEAVNVISTSGTPAICAWEF